MTVRRECESHHRLPTPWTRLILKTDRLSWESMQIKEEECIGDLQLSREADPAKRQSLLLYDKDCLRQRLSYAINKVGANSIHGIRAPVEKLDCFETESGRLSVKRDLEVADIFKVKIARPERQTVEEATNWELSSTIRTDGCGIHLMWEFPFQSKVKVAHRGQEE